MKDFTEAFSSREFPLDGVHLVAASAGTGKTYNIQNIFARLIMERGYRVRQILVVTFTKASTRELQERLRNILVELSRRLGDEAVTPSYAEQVESLLDCLSDEGRAQARSRVATALLEFDQSAISTIHGFCQKSLSRYAFESGLRFNCRMGDAADADLTKLARDWWRTESYAYDERFAEQKEYTVDVLATFMNGIANRPGCRIADEVTEDTAAGFLLHVAERLVHTYKAGWLNRENMTYDDLIYGMKDALDKDRNIPGTPLVTALRQEYKAALIDEFQDTDPQQYAIFRRIFLEDWNAPVFFVGDPKQAIYSFRGGDIFAYERAVRELPPDRVYELSRNFRSTPQLIKAVNAIFKDHRRPDGGVEYTFGSSAMPYDGTLKSNPKQRPLRVYNSNTKKWEEETACFHILTQEARPGRLAWNITSELLLFDILSLLNGKGTAGCPYGQTQIAEKVPGSSEVIYRDILPKDIAVLACTKENCIAIRNELNSCGVKSVLFKCMSVFNTVMATALQFMLEAIANPLHRSQVKSALMTPLAGLNPEEVANLSEEELTAYVEQFLQLHDILQQKGFSSVMAEVERRFNVRQRVGALEGGERMLSDFLQLTTLCQNEVTSRNLNPEEVMEWLGERIRNKESEKEVEEYQQLLETEEDAVRIITMHSSKGLQFPIVYLPECWKKTAPPGQRLFFFHDEAKGLRVTLAKDNERYRQEESQEQLRKIYVAMTRAQCRCVVLTPDRASEELQTLLSRLGSDLATAGDDTGSSPFALVNSHKDDMQQLLSYRMDRNYTFMPFQAPPVVEVRRQKGSYSVLTPGHEPEMESESDEPDDEMMVPGLPAADIFRLFPGGAVIGDCWHDILEEADFTERPVDREAESIQDGGVVEEIVPRSSLEELVKSKLEAYGFLNDALFSVNQGRFDVTVSMIHRVLDYPLQDEVTGEVFSLREIGRQARASEWEFRFPSADACDSTRQIARILERYWQGMPGKEPFLKRLKNWNYLIPHGYFVGFMDLVFCRKGRFYVVDWKSNQIGGDIERFSEAGVVQEMADAGYFVQYLLYATVLHHFLKERMGNAYSYERHFGGVTYYFLRGIACHGKAPVFSDRPPEALLDELSVAFGLGRKA